MGVAATLVMKPGLFEQTFVPPSHGNFIWNFPSIGPVVSEEKMFKECGRQTIDARRRPTFGSGELIMPAKQPNNMCMCIYMVLECTYCYSGGYKFWPVLLYPPQKSAGYYVIPSEPVECPSARPSVSASFPDSNLSSFCMDIDIGEKWFGIANGLNSFINNSFMALDWCKNVIFLSIFKTNGFIDIYKIHVVSNARYFWSLFNRVMALDQRQNVVYAQYLVN